MTDAAERQKAYRERMKAEGKRAITIYIPEAVYQEIKGNPQVIIDAYVNRNKGSLFNDQGLRTTEVQDIKERVNAIENKLSDNLVCDKCTEIGQAVTELRKRVALLQDEQDNLVKRCNSLQIDNNENKAVINSLQTKCDSIFEMAENLKSNFDNLVVNSNKTKLESSQSEPAQEKKVGTKFEPHWYDEYLAMNKDKTGKSRISETAFAKLKGVHKSTISRAFAKLRKERASDGTDTTSNAI
ncbi:MAG: hypothetical protein HQL06_08780 [Nitrospirae bacterium]|nr:hypothetical protein [Nitrospirota bacterium]